MTSGRRLLVVDDTPENLDAARRYFAGLQDTEADFVDNYADASKMLAEGIQRRTYDGMLTDVFMPMGWSEGRRIVKILGEVYKNSREIVKWDSINKIHRELLQEGPAGVALGLQAEAVDLPYVACTSLGHHAIKCEAIAGYLLGKAGWHSVKVALKEGRDGTRDENNPMYDRPSDHKDNPEFWREAHEKLKRMIQK